MVGVYPRNGGPQLGPRGMKGRCVRRQGLGVSPRHRGGRGCGPRLVRAVCGKYVAAMGRESRPMTADYIAVIENHHVWIVEEGGEIPAALLLVVEPDAMTFENASVSELLQGF